MTETSTADLKKTIPPMMVAPPDLAAPPGTSAPAQVEPSAQTASGAQAAGQITETSTAINEGATQDSDASAAAEPPEQTVRDSTRPQPEANTGAFSQDKPVFFTDLEPQNDQQLQQLKNDAWGSDGNGKIGQAGVVHLLIQADTEGQWINDQVIAARLTQQGQTADANAVAEVKKTFAAHHEAIQLINRINLAMDAAAAEIKKLPTTATDADRNAIREKYYSEPMPGTYTLIETGETFTPDHFALLVGAAQDLAADTTNLTRQALIRDRLDVVTPHLAPDNKSLRDIPLTELKKKELDARLESAREIGSLILREDVGQSQSSNTTEGDMQLAWVSLFSGTLEDAIRRNPNDPNINTLVGNLTAAEATYLANHPDLPSYDSARQALDGNVTYYRKSGNYRIAENMNDVLQMLEQKNPKFQNFRQQIKDGLIRLPNLAIITTGLSDAVGAWQNGSIKFGELQARVTAMIPTHTITPEEGVFLNTFMEEHYFESLQATLSHGLGIDSKILRDPITYINRNITRIAQDAGLPTDSATIDVLRRRVLVHNDQIGKLDEHGLLTLNQLMFTFMVVSMLPNFLAPLEAGVQKGDDRSGGGGE